MQNNKEHLKDKVKNLLVQIQQQVHKLVQYRNPSWTLHPYYFVIPNKTFNDFYHKERNSLFVVHLATHDLYFFLSSIFNFRLYSLNAVTWVRSRKPYQ